MGVITSEVKIGKRGTDRGWQALRWTRDAYHRLGESGFFEDKRVELVEGEIIEMAPMAAPHAMALMKCQEALEDVVKRRFWIRVQLPFIATSGSELQPDLALVDRDGNYLKSHPKTAVLVVEVSDSTLGYDRGLKAALYAAAGVQEYWVLNLGKRQLEIYSDPNEDSTSTNGFKFKQSKVLKASEAVSPAFDTGVSIPVESLLP